MEPATASRLSRFFGSFGKFFGGTISTGASFAAGVAVAPTLEPVVRELVNEAWSHYQTMPLRPGDWAEIVAEDVDKLTSGEREAKKHGVKPDDFDELVEAVKNAPGFAELLTLWRRDAITDADFVHGLRKARLETRWDTPLEKLKTDRLDPAVMATAIQRRVVNDPGYLISPPSISGSNVPPMPVSALNADDEAMAHGVDPDRLAVLTRIVGLPPAPGELLQLLNRGEINEDAFNLGVVEGNTRQEWAPFLMKLRRRLLTPHEYAEGRLRGLKTTPELHAGAALVGMEPSDADFLFELLGRPLPVHAITTGLARGGTFGGEYAGVPEPYRDAIRRSSIRPEYGNIAYANRYTMPSPFVMRGLTQAGTWSEAKAALRLRWAGWIPEDADEAAADWAKGTKAAAAKEETAPQLRAEHDGWYLSEAELLAGLEALGYPATVAAKLGTLTDAARVKGYVDKAVEKVYKAYTGKAITEPQARAGLTTLKVGTTAVDNLLVVWNYVLALESTPPPVA